MKFADLLAQYPRIAIAGPPRTGKTTYTEQVSDRPVIHTDDWMYTPWRELPAQVAAACTGLTSFVLEGVRAPDVLRTAGVEVDAVVWLSKAKVQQTPEQRAMGIGVHTVLEHWAGLHPEVPIVTEEDLEAPTLDHADLPQTTRRYAVWTLDASQIQRTPQGGLRIPARVSKAGVFKYQRGQRVLREYRPASELRKPEALATFKGAPIVVLHPNENGGAVDPTNAKQLTVGHFEDPFFNEETQAIEGYVVTNDGETIRRIDAGELADISSAYDNGRDFTPGFTPEREPYDLIQTDYVCNHIALGPPGWGRQGQDVGLLTLDANDNQVAALPPSTEEAMPADKTPAPTKDSADPPPAPAPAPAPAPTPAPVDKPKTADEAPLTPEEIGALRSIAQMLPALTKLVNTGNPNPPVPVPAPVLEKTADGDGKKTMDADDIERIAQEGIEVRTEAIGVLGDKYSPKGKSTRQVRVDVIKTFDSKFTADGKSDESISTAYSVALLAGTERNKHTKALAGTRLHGTVTMDGTQEEAPKPLGHQAYDAWREAPAAKN
jgi:hypothetical protein